MITSHIFAAVAISAVSFVLGYFCGELYEDRRDN
jgi:hypothetical protein